AARLQCPSPQHCLDPVGSPVSPMPVRDLRGPLSQNATAIAPADAGAIILPSIYRHPNESGEEIFEASQNVTFGRDIQGAGKGSMGNAVGTKIISLIFTALLALGFLAAARQEFSLLEIFLLFYLALVVSWGGPPFRYLLPI